MPETLYNADLFLLELVNRHWKTSLLDAWMPELSHGPLFWTCIAAVAALALLRRYGRQPRVLVAALALLGLSVGTADQAALLAKTHVMRIRPHKSVGDVFYLHKSTWRQTPSEFTPPHDDTGTSFYSGHATNSMALGATMAAVLPHYRLLAYLLPLGVGYSRVYLGKHFPSDVCIGWAAGWLFGRFYGRLFRRLRVRFS